MYSGLGSLKKKKQNIGHEDVKHIFKLILIKGNDHAIGSLKTHEEWVTLNFGIKLLILV